MEVKIQISGCPYEDAEQLKHYLNALDYASLIRGARELVRSRLKWGEDITPQEEKALEELRDCLLHQDIN